MVARLHPPPLNRNGVRVERHDRVRIRGAPIRGDGVEDGHKIHVVHAARPPQVATLQHNNR